MNFIKRPSAQILPLPNCLSVANSSELIISTSRTFAFVSFAYFCNLNEQQHRYPFVHDYGTESMIGRETQLIILLFRFHWSTIGIIFQVILRIRERFVSLFKYFPNNHSTWWILDLSTVQKSLGIIEHLKKVNREEGARNSKTSTNFKTTENMRKISAIAKLHEKSSGSKINRDMCY